MPVMVNVNCRKICYFSRHIQSWLSCAMEWTISVGCSVVWHFATQRAARRRTLRCGTVLVPLWTHCFNSPTWLRCIDYWALTAVDQWGYDVGNHGTGQWRTCVNVRVLLHWKRHGQRIHGIVIIVNPQMTSLSSWSINNAPASHCMVAT